MEPPTTAAVQSCGSPGGSRHVGLDGRRLVALPSTGPVELGEDDAGDLMAVWIAADATLHAQVYDPQNNPLGPAFVIPLAPQTLAASASVVGVPSGGFVVAWANTTGVEVQRFDAQGNRTGGQIQADTETGDGNVATAIDANGDLVITWSNTVGATVSQTAQRYAPWP